MYLHIYSFFRYMQNAPIKSQSGFVVYTNHYKTMLNAGKRLNAI